MELKYSFRPSNFFYVLSILFIAGFSYLFFDTIIERDLKHFFYSLVGLLMGFGGFLFRLEITSTGIRGIHELSLFGKTIFRKEYYQYRWENTIIFKYFGWPIWGLVVKHRKSFASIGLVNSLYLNDFRTASRAIYIFAKNKAYYIDDETVSYLRSLPPLLNEEN